MICFLFAVQKALPWGDSSEQAGPQFLPSWGLQFSREADIKETVSLHYLWILDLQRGTEMSIFSPGYIKSLWSDFQPPGGDQTKPIKVFPICLLLYTELEQFLHLNQGHRGSFSFCGWATDLLRNKDSEVKATCKFKTNTVFRREP